MTENMERFLEEVAKDEALAEALDKAETPEAVAALAAEKGFTLTEEDLRPDEPQGELEDEALDDVAGGMSWIVAPRTGFGRGLRRRGFNIGKGKSKLSGLVHYADMDDGDMSDGVVHASNLLNYGQAFQPSTLEFRIGGEEDDYPKLTRL